MSIDDRQWGFAGSTGLSFTHPTIVDAHFDACRTEYRYLLTQAGVAPGWRVLDAGCGAGDFLPWLVELVGPDGRIAAVDLAGENVALTARRIRTPPCPVALAQGDLRCLPYAEASFDAVWCANTVQYLDDDELALALAEMRRVVRPGGIVAIKELDPRLIFARPADPDLFAEFFRAAGRLPGYARQLLRAGELYRHLKRAGLAGVRQQTVLIEHFAPLTARAQAFYGPTCARLAGQALRMGLSAEWERFVDPDGPANPLRDPDGYISEGGVLAVGVVPESAH